MINAKTRNALTAMTLLKFSGEQDNKKPSLGMLAMASARAAGMMSPVRGATVASFAIH